MKSEVIVQKSHRNGYDHAVRNCGIRLIEVETAEEMERAIDEQAAMMFFFNDADPKGAGQAGAASVAIAKKHNPPSAQ
jgi:L-seryl-tRNA(Ser) seleniumtransferase